MKNALITGASHGIGQAIAIELAKNNYNVGINYLCNLSGAKFTQKKCKEFGVRTFIYKTDVSSCEELEDMFIKFEKDLGAIDLMVNNAGISKFYPFLETREEDFIKLTFTDWKGSFFGTQYAARNMIKHSKKGVIINISSNHADGCWPNATIYGPTKAALTKFGKNAAMELASYGIRVITVAPGYTDVGWDHSTGIYECEKLIPLQRFARPSEVAQIVRFLASDSCAYMTGNCVTVDGGSLLPIVPENDLQGGVKVKL